MLANDVGPVFVDVANISPTLFWLWLCQSSLEHLNAFNAFKDCGLESDPVYKSAWKPMQIAKFCSQIIIMYEQMIKVANAVQNSVKKLADLGEILISLENFVFARGELIF